MNRYMKLSKADNRLLNTLQRDATCRQTEFADIAGMSRTSSRRRIRDFEEGCLIKRYAGPLASLIVI